MKEQKKIKTNTHPSLKVLKNLVKTLVIVTFLMLLVIAFKLPIMRVVTESGLLYKILGTGEMVAEVVPVSNHTTLPEVTGQYKVGRTKIKLIDYSRYDLFKEEKNESDCYELMLRVYYPTNETRDVGTYVSDSFIAKSTKYIINEQGESPFKYIHQNALDDVKCADLKEGFPVVVFAPGGSWPIELYSYIFEEWASHGYVVFAVTDPLSSPIIELEDGNVFEPANTKQSDFMLLGGTGAKGVAEPLNYYIQQANAIDILFVVNQLNAINKKHEILSGKINLDTIVAAGHSIGGASAVKASLLTDAIDGVIIYDSYLFHVLDKTDPYMKVPNIYFDSEGIEYDAEAKELVNEYMKENMAYLNGSGLNSYHLLDGASHAAFMVDLILSVSKDDATRYDLIKDVENYNLAREIIDVSLMFLDSIND